MDLDPRALVEEGPRQRLPSSCRECTAAEQDANDQYQRDRERADRPRTDRGDSMSHLP